mgnify:CR=1 FL=1
MEQAATNPRRRGNVRKGLWLRGCYKYAQALAKKCPSQESTSDHGLSSHQLELSIYGALSNNVKVLLDHSPQAKVTWLDRLWVLVKAAHDRDVMAATATHRAKKMEQSALYVNM